MITAAVLEKFNKKLKIIKNIKIPKLLSKQVLIKIRNTAICGSQIHEIKGHRNTKKYLPHLLGHEATGIVIDTSRFVEFQFPFFAFPSFERTSPNVKIDGSVLSRITI